MFPDDDRVPSSNDGCVAENASDVSRCECPPSCRQVAYDATISGSMLSDMFIHTLLTRSFWPDIQRRYVSALDVHSRVDTDSMTTLRQLVALERTYQTLSSIIDVDLLDPTTSVVGDIYNVIGLVVQMTHDSVRQFRTQLIQPFTDTYEQKVDFFVRRIVDHANAFLAHHASSYNGSFADPDVNGSATAFCRYFAKFWKWFKDDFDDPFRAWPFSDRKACSGQLYRTCRTFPLNWTTAEEMKMAERTKVWVKCMTQFREFLGDVDSWLKTQATLNSSLPLTVSDDAAVLVKLTTNTNRLRNTTDNFRLHAISKVYEHCRCIISTVDSSCQPIHFLSYLVLAES